MKRTNKIFGRRTTEESLRIELLAARKAGDASRITRAKLALDRTVR